MKHRVISISNLVFYVTITAVLSFFLGVLLTTRVTGMDIKRVNIDSNAKVANITEALTVSHKEELNDKDIKLVEANLHIVSLLDRVAALQNIVDVNANKVIPPTLLLPVTNVQQKPQLPNGCEGTSLSILLNYLGYEADKVDISMNYIPRGSIVAGSDPNVEYAGNPSGTGWYCYAGAAKIGAELFLHAEEANAIVTNLTGATEDKLISTLNDGNPIVIWGTLDLQSSGRRAGYSTIDGAAFINLHCVVLVGYTETDFIFCNPLSKDKYTFIPKDSFMNSYESIGSRALIIEEHELLNKIG